VDRIEDVFKGSNLLANAQSKVYQLDVEIKYFMITNAGEIPAVINVFVKSGALLVRLSPKNLTLPIGQGFRGFGLIIQNLETIVVNVTSGSVDYYFSIFGE